MTIPRTHVEFEQGVLRLICEDVTIVPLLRACVPLKIGSGQTSAGTSTESQESNTLTINAAQLYNDQLIFCDANEGRMVHALLGIEKHTMKPMRWKRAQYALLHVRTRE